MRQNLIFSMRQQQQQQLQYQQQQRHLLKLQAHAKKTDEANDGVEAEKRETMLVIEKRKNNMKHDSANVNELNIKKRAQSSEPVEKKLKKISIADSDEQRQSQVNGGDIGRVCGSNTSPHQSNGLVRASLSPAKSPSTNPISSSSLNYSKGPSHPKASTSLISNANMSNILTGACILKSHESSSSKNNNAAIFGISSNPIMWSASDVCKYLVNNKFDSNLVHLIEEHVSQLLNPKGSRLRDWHLKFNFGEYFLF